MKRKQTNDQYRAYEDGRWTALCGGKAKNPFIAKNGQPSNWDLYAHWEDGFEDGLIEKDQPDYAN